MLLLEEKSENSSVCYFDSSNIYACKYNNDTQQLAIIFKEGTQYVYYKISNYTFQRFKIAESQGIAFNKHIKGKFDYGKGENIVDVAPILTLITELKKQK